MALVYPANFPALGRGPFLALMQEKKQKKIKVPGAPAKLAGYMIDGGEALGQVFTLLTVRSSGAYGRAGVWGG